MCRMHLHDPSLVLHVDRVGLPPEAQGRRRRRRELERELYGPRRWARYGPRRWARYGPRRWPRTGPSGYPHEYVVALEHGWAPLGKARHVEPVPEPVAVLDRVELDVGQVVLSEVFDLRCFLDP